MAEQFYTILTKIGKAKIANTSALGSKLNLAKFQVGDSNGSYYNPTEEQTELKHKVWEGPISSITIDENNPNWIVLQTMLPGDIGGFMIREAGVFDDEGNLIAIGKYPETYKPVVAEGSTKDLLIKMILEVSNASSVTLKIDPTTILATKKDIEILENTIKNIKVPVTKVNEKIGNVVLTAEDIKCKNGTTIESSLDDKASKTSVNNFTKPQVLNTWGAVGGNSRGQVLLGANMITEDTTNGVKIKATKNHDNGATGISLSLFSDNVYVLRQNGKVTEGQELTPTETRLLTQKDYDQLFQFASDKNRKIASAVTDMGVPTDAKDNGDTVAGNIRKINNLPKLTKTFDDIPSQSSGYLAKSIQGITKDYIYRASDIKKQYVTHSTAFDKTDFNGTLISSGSFDLGDAGFINYTDDRHYNYESMNKNTYWVHECDNNNTRLRSAAIPMYEDNGRYSVTPRYCCKDKILTTNNSQNYYFYDFSGTKLSEYSGGGVDFEKIIFTASVPSGRVIMYTNPNSGYEEVYSFDFKNNIKSLFQPVNRAGTPSNVLSYTLLAPFLF